MVQDGFRNSFRIAEGEKNKTNYLQSNPLDKVNEAHDLLNNSSIQGKIVLSLLKD